MAGEEHTREVTATDFSTDGTGPTPVGQRGWSRPPGLTRVEVLGADLFEELTEPLDLFLLVVRHLEPGLVEDLLAADDPGAGAQRERDRVRRAGAHLDALAEHEQRIEDAVAHFGDLHLGELVSGRREDVLQ